MSTLGANAVITAERPLGATVQAILLPMATILALLGLSLLPLLTPAWLHAAMAGSGGSAAGATLEQSQRLSDLTVQHLVFGLGTFDITMPDGRPLYGPDEIAHMQDVRTVLLAFLAASFLSGLLITWSLVRPAGARTWRAIARGGAALVVGLIAVGTFAALAFGVAFELFHVLLFPGGNWAFDPAQSNLVRMYPLGFWQLSAAAYGAIAISAASVTWWLARQRAARVEGET